MSSCMEPQMSRNHVKLVANTAWEWLESGRKFSFGPLPKKRQERDRQERQIEKQAHRKREKYTMERRASYFAVGQWAEQAERAERAERLSSAFAPFILLWPHREFWRCETLLQASNSACILSWEIWMKSFYSYPALLFF